jgi:hypothetical protein
MGALMVGPRSRRSTRPRHTMASGPRTMTPPQASLRCVIATVLSSSLPLLLLMPWTLFVLARRFATTVLRSATRRAPILVTKVKKNVGTGKLCGALDGVVPRRAFRVCTYAPFLSLSLPPLSKREFVVIHKDHADVVLYLY